MKSVFNRGRLGALAGGILWLTQTAVQACPGCKPVEGAPLSGASIGFGADIFFMLAMIGSLLGGLGWMVYKSCQTLAARDRALAAAEGVVGDALPG